jgi:hypothetical protein
MIKSIGNPFNKILAKHFPNLGKVIDIQVQKRTDIL